jgi:hypothetical protein
MADTTAPDSKDLDKFVAGIRNYCRSFRTFVNKIRVNRGHLVERAGETNQHIRNVVLGNQEMIASLIIHGALVKARCHFTHPIEAVFEGNFCDVSVAIFESNYREVNFERIPVRVVVREDKPRHVVVSVHEITDRKNTSSLPEVPKNVW